MADDVYSNVRVPGYQVGKFRFVSGILRITNEDDKIIFTRILAQLPSIDRSNISLVTSEAVSPFPPDWPLALANRLSEIAAEGVIAQAAARANLGIADLGVGVTDGDKGDVIVSASGATWTVDPALLASYLTQAVANTLYSALGHGHVQGDVTGLTAALAAKAVAGDATASGLTANTSRILGRVTGGSGALEELSLGAGLGFSGSQIVVTSGVTDGDKGDVVVSGSGANWAFDSGVVTAFARTLLDDADAATVRGTLGLGTAALSLTGDFVAAAHAGAGGAVHANVVAAGAAGFMTGADKTKLDGVAAGATTNSSDAVLLARANHTGTQSADTVVDGATNKAYTGAEKTKLAGVATGATANSSDATLLSRANHTGTQAIATVSAAATSRIFGRITAGAGAGEELTAAQVITILGLATVATSGSASDLGTGTIPAARFPAMTGDVTAGAGSNATTIGAGTVTLAKMANIATATFIGRVTAATGVPEALTGTQATTLLNVFTSALKGLAPASGGGTTNFLRADGTWAVPAAGAAGSTTQFQYNNAGAMGGASGTAWDDANRSLAISGATVTASKPILDLSQTWNNSGVAFTGFKFNITQTAQSSTSKPFDWQLGGVSKFWMDNDGYPSTSTGLGVYSGATAVIFAYSSGIDMASTARLGFTSGSAFMGADTILLRETAGVMGQRNGANGQSSLVYGTYTDVSNYRRLARGMSTAGVAFLRPEGAGTGASGNVLHISGLPAANPGPGILWNNAGLVAIGT